MKFRDILQIMKNLRLHNISVHRDLYQNRLINECARENLAYRVLGSYFIL